MPFFLDLTHFKGQGRNPSKNFVAFLENLRHHIFVLRLSDLYIESLNFLKSKPVSILFLNFRGSLEQFDSQQLKTHWVGCSPFFVSTIKFQKTYPWTYKGIMSGITCLLRVSWRWNVVTKLQKKVTNRLTALSIIFNQMVQVNP